jgi:alpha-L-fucosidase 2
MGHLRAVSAACLFVASSVIPGSPVGAQPRAEHGLTYTTPALVWDEALPLGNGLLGALVWGDGRPLRISLDRTDLWDLRPVPEFHSPEYSYKMMRQWVREGRIEDLHRLYDKPYGYPGPTKIPAGRIELMFGDRTKFQTASLDIAKATVAMQCNDGMVARVFVHATEPLGVIHITGKPTRVMLMAPPFAGKVTEEVGANKISAGDLATLRYEAPVQQSGDTWTWYLQKGWGDLRFAVALAWRGSDSDWLGVWSVCTSKDAVDPLAAARKRCEAALDQGLGALTRDHEQWWNSYWSKASVSVPNPVIERQWYLETYKFGAVARPDTPPITLQGPWTADDRKIPPWKGDYHHDLNTQLSYWPA